MQVILRWFRLRAPRALIGDATLVDAVEVGVRSAICCEIELQFRDVKTTMKMGESTVKSPRWGVRRWRTRPSAKAPAASRPRLGKLVVERHRSLRVANPRHQVAARLIVHSLPAGRLVGMSPSGSKLEHTK